MAARIFLLIAIALTNRGQGAPSRPWVDIIVDQSGAGDFRTISSALASLPDFHYGRTVIFIRDGVYNEKIRIDRNYITLRGESREGTIIRYSQLREDWNRDRDAVGPAIINIHADDTVLDNLTVENAQPVIGPHAFAVLGYGTRTVIIRCNLVSQGADTVALWDYRTGMYYHADCFFQGAVDFVCPRGWCFIRNSRFFEVKKSAALWHAGHFEASQKLVVVDSEFDGIPGFKLGRHHYEAQFLLCRCRFSANMSGEPIYRVTYEDTARNNPYIRGDRRYFYGCVYQGGDLPWLADNLNEAPESPEPVDLNPAWTFGGRWDPESEIPPRVTDFRIDGSMLILRFDEPVTVRGEPALELRQGDTLKIVKCRFVDDRMLRFEGSRPLDRWDILEGLGLVKGEILASKASARERLLERIMIDFGG